MTKNCKYNEITGEEPTLNDCDKCIEKFDMPYHNYCIEHCNKYSICEGCKKGINLINDFISGKPNISGNYMVKDKFGEIKKDDYTSSGGGHWWNSNNDGSTLYSPSSFRELGSY